MLRFFLILFFIYSPLYNKANNFITSKDLLILEENKGQIKNPDNSTNRDIKFVFKSKNLSIFISPNGLIYQFHNFIMKKDSFQTNEFINSKTKKPEIQSIETHRFDMNLLNSNSNCEIITEGRSNDYVNDYNNNALDIHSYQKIIVKNIYEKIDWIIYIKDHQLKYDFIIHPNGDYKKIKMKYMAMDNIFLRDNNLEIETSLGKIIEKAPVVFQNEKIILSKFIIKDSIVSFNIDYYNKNSILIIDPQIAWSTYFGGTGYDVFYSISSDKSNNICAVGMTMSTSNIAYLGFQNSFPTSSTQAGMIAKFLPNGTRIWSTYYGPAGLLKTIIDSKNNLYTITYVNSTFPNSYAFIGHQMSSGGNQDAFIAKFDSSGYRIRATFFGGTYDDFISEAVVDSSDNLYITGVTTSRNNIYYNGLINDLVTFVGFNGSLDSGNTFLVKFDSSGVRKWGTYYGANYIGNQLLAINNQNQLFLSSIYSDTTYIFSSTSPSFCKTRARNYIAKFDTLGIRLSSNCLNLDTFLNIGDMCVDLKHNIILCGITGISNFNNNGFQNIFGGGQDGYIIKLDSNYNKIWSSYIGGNSGETPSNIIIDKKNNIYITGKTTSPNNFFYRGFKSVISGIDDVFVVKIKEDGSSKLWGSYYGGNLREQAYSTYLDKNENLYICGYTNSTSGISLNGFQNTYGGGANDGFLVKITCRDTTTLHDTICSHQYKLFSQDTLRTSGTYRDTLENWEGCDSFVILHLWVKKTDTTYIDSSVCKGSEVFFKGSSRDTTGFYRDTLINQYGCDSLLILRLIVHKNDTTTLSHTLCGNAPYLFNNMNLMSTGTYYDTLKNVTNCDSLLVLNFTRNLIDTTHIYDTICDKTPYVFNGNNLTTSGLYRDTLSNQSSCDSFIFLHLVVHPLDTTRMTKHICSGQTYLFNNLTLSQSGTYFKTLKNQKKCDSTLVLTLNVHKPDTTFQNNFFCRGTIYNFYGQNLTQPGNYTKTLSNQYLCDSTIILTLSYRRPYNTTIDTAICYGNLFKTYQTSGVYTESYTSVNGCDSTVTIKLTVSNKPIKDTILYSECNKITLNNTVYTQSQWIQETLKTTHNCDSIFRTHVLNITQIIPVKRKDSTIHFCETMVYKQHTITKSLELSDTIKITFPPYCDSILQNINFIKVPKPIVTIQATPLDTLVKGQVISLEASKHSNYLWSTGDKIQTIYKQLYTDTIIQLKAWDYSGCEDSTSIAIWVKDRTEIGVPSAFSPNGDGKNDFFEINNLNSDYQILTAQIYNRWGEKVYQSPNSNTLKWNGTYKNELVPSGIYIYIINYKYLPLQIIKELKGTIQVMY